MTLDEFPKSFFPSMSISASIPFSHPIPQKQIKRETLSRRFRDFSSGFPSLKKYFEQSFVPRLVQRKISMKIFSRKSFHQITIINRSTPPKKPCRLLRNCPPKPPPPKCHCIILTVYTAFRKNIPNVA